MNEVFSLLEPYKSQLEFNHKPKEGLEVLYWILESYAIAVHTLNPPTCRLEALLIIQKLPLLLFSDWREVNTWIELNIKPPHQKLPQSASDYIARL